MNVQEYVLAGDREFMSRELAEKAFAPLLVEGSAFKRVSICSNIWRPILLSYIRLKNLAWHDLP